MMNINDFKKVAIYEFDTSIPTFTYTDKGEIGKAGSYALITFGSKPYRVELDPATGTLNWTAPEAVEDGSYSFSLVIVDRAGNHSQAGLATFVIDTTPPEAPRLYSIYDDQGKESLFLPGGTSDDKTPTLTGNAQRGSTVYLKNDKGETIGSAVADKETGEWVITPTVELKDGENNLTLVAVENFAKADRVGTPMEFVINVAPDAGVLPPDTITITQAFDDAGTATGPLSNGALTDDTTPTLSGSVSANSVVTVFYRLAGSNTWAGSATATVTGESWSWTPDSALPTGVYEFQAAIADKSSALFTLDIASAADIISRTRIDAVEDDFGTATGLLASGAITDDATPTFRGSAEANSKVVIRYTQVGNVAASVVVDADSAGKWSWTPGSDLPGGTWGFAVKAQGQDGWTSDFVLNIADAAGGGFAPIITHAYDDVGTTQNLANGDTTDDTTPTLYGRAEANSQLTLRYRTDSGSYDSVQIDADSGGNWSWTPDAELSNGSWAFEVQKAGQTDWNSFDLIIDSEFDRKPTIDYADDNVGTVRDPLHSGDTTDDTTPTLQGSGPSDTLIFIRYKLDGGNYSNASLKTKADGTWSWTPPQLAKGEWTFAVGETKDSFGDDFNLKVDYVGTLTVQATRYYDSVGPNIGWKVWNSQTVTNDSTPLLAGTYLPNSGFYIHFANNGAEAHHLGYVTTNGNGDWTYQIPSSAPLNDFKIGNQTVIGWGLTPAAAATHNTFISYMHYSTTVPEYQIPWVDKSVNADGTGKTASLMIDENDPDSRYELTQTKADISSENNQSGEFADTLTLTGKNQIIDVTLAQNKVADVNIIDLTGTGDNTLRIDLNALLQHGEKDLFIEDGKTQMVVKGNEGDVVQLADILPEGGHISEWQHMDGTVTVAGVEYQVYSHGEDAELLVQQGVKTELI
ncbi:hypothetical protein HX773_17765 [Pantoea sp. B9002]|uniref:Ig-like domain-containing protein n=1 Tax=Pantoea sp. B9002 TaxID=2726979 RepID=UPI0015A03B9B|nr:Ig-like domain-containing protein [Pantoea sp. B9002]NWA62752.1 hypothetical protein [Pantoea sp. B9002]